MSHGNIMCSMATVVNNTMFHIGKLPRDIKSSHHKKKILQLRMMTDAR